MTKQNKGASGAQEATNQELCSAIESGKTELVGELLTKGADCNAQGNDGRMALHIALDEGHFQIASMLLDNEADVTIEDGKERNALHAIAEVQGITDDVLFRRIADRLKAAGSKETEFTFTDDEEDKTPRLDETNYNGSTPLANAIAANQLSYASYLVDNNCNLPGSIMGNSPIHYAALYQNAEMFTYLVNKDQSGLKWENPLETCFDENDSVSEEFANACIQAGIEITSDDAVEYEIYSQILHFMQEGELDANELEDDVLLGTFHAAMEGNPPVFKSLSEEHKQALLKGGGIALQEAVKKGDRALVEELLAKGADCNVQGDDGRTALHIALDEGHFQIASMLLNNEADVTIRDIGNRHALHIISGLYAKEYDLFECIANKLIEVDPKLLNKKDANGLTPVDSTIIANQLDYTKFLVQNGGELHENIVEQPSLFFAAGHQSISLFAYLIEQGLKINLEFGDPLEVCFEEYGSIDEKFAEVYIQALEKQGLSFTSEEAVEYRIYGQMLRFIESGDLDINTLDEGVLIGVLCLNTDNDLSLFDKLSGENKEGVLNNNVAWMGALLSDNQKLFQTMWEHTENTDRSQILAMVVKYADAGLQGAGQALQGLEQDETITHSLRNAKEKYNAAKQKFSPAELHSTYGIEIELIYPDFVDKFFPAGSEQNLDSKRLFGHKDQPKTPWQKTIDGSIKAGDGEVGREFVSGIMHDRNDLKEVSSLADMLVEMGAKSDKSCGLHVHVGIDSRFPNDYDMQLKVVKQLIINYATLEDKLKFSERTYNIKGYQERFYDKNVPKDAVLGGVLDARNLEELMSFNQDTKRSGNVDRDVALNLAAYFVHGTVELRAHPGSVDSKHIGNWLEFVDELVGQSIAMAQSKEGPHIPDKDENLALENMVKVLHKKGTALLPSEEKFSNKEVQTGVEKSSGRDRS